MLTKTKDRHTRKRPFVGWMKRLANLKPSSSDAPSKKNNANKKPPAKNNPYPESGYINTNTHAPDDSLSVSTPATPCSNGSSVSLDEAAVGQRQGVEKSNKSTAPTVATLPETLNSTRSKAETGGSNFVNGGSTFSSPHGSEHSLTTTLTTIQSTAPSNALNVAQTQHHNNAAASNAPPVHFSHQFPTSPPPLAIPPHMAAQQPNSYQGATANNVLTDNASILTLASSSKRRRRNSVDTNASMRALAPSSHYGGSRESLPLSVLSANPETIYSPSNRPSNVGAFVNAERASVYSASGVTAPVLSSDRNSYFANKQTDGLSVRSGLLGHGRTDSISSIRATPTSPLASPRDPMGPARISRKSSEWKEAREASDEDEAPASPIVEEHEPKSKPKRDSQT
ncbi:hypothetical protein yc1106_03946 [Curvularia clavata]|uniref:Uncharacterized protein n=1 Tax=Curvularia clavata TaxID=95742 RepID=A0A9Q9DRI0_CURCL|nr:hypothetical protein yc1106_03946 [Curvularia clavata]